jgi:hypothetical protein
MAEKLGKLTIDEVELCYFDEDPRLNGGVDAPVGSIGFVKENNSFIYQKFDIGNENWRPIDANGVGLSSIAVSNTDTVTNLHVDTNPEYQTEVPITGNILRESSNNDFEVQGNLIKCNFSGYIVCEANIILDSNSSNTRTVLKYKKNSSIFFGNRGYFRNRFDFRSTLLYGIIQVAPNDTIGIYSQDVQSSGTVTMEYPNECIFSITRVL